MIENPNRFSLFILGGITVFAIAYAALTWRKAPQRSSFTVAEDAELGFDLGKPDQVYYLPGKLEEISGLSYWQDDQLAAIQDEDGELFIYDLGREKIVREIKFGKDRDYEGVATHDSMVYVLEMDGDIHYFRIGQNEENEYESEKFESLFSYRNDTEGICYDPVTGKLLVAPKEEQLNPTEQNEHLKYIYAVNPATGDIASQPAFEIDQYRIGEIVYGKRERYLFKPSGVAVHPNGENIYLIASVGNLLIVLDRSGAVLHVELLDKKLFPQPEGITFNPAGELFISSEARGGKALIARYAVTE